MSTTRRTAAGVLVAAAGAIAMAGPAAAGRYGNSVIYEENFEVGGPVKGYSGPVWAGRRNYWCDYQRLPNRKCTIGRDGQEHCKIVSWTLKQYCY